MGDTLQRLTEGRKQSRRMWWVMPSLIGLILAIMLWLFLFYDGLPPDDQKLLPHWTKQQSTNPNPLVVFLGELDGTLLVEYSHLPERVRKRENGTESAVREFVSKQQKIYVAFDKLMQSDRSSWQWPDREKVSTGGGSGEEVGQCGEMAQTLNMRIHALTLEGKTEEACELSLSLARFGAGLLGSEGNEIHALVGLTVQHVGEDALQRILVDSNPTPELLHKCLRELEDLESPLRKDIQFAYRADYLWFKNTLLKLDRRRYAGFSSKGPIPLQSLALAMSVFYKPNRTLAICVQLEQPLIEGLDRSWAEGYAASWRTRQLCDDLTRGRNHATFYLDGNFGGKSLLAMNLENFGGIIDKALIASVLHGQAKLMLALHLFELEKGKLPLRLDELVPTYIPAIPEDSFTAKPMLWSAEKQVVYSVGPDGTDGGGLINLKSPKKGVDVGMRYWWSVPQFAPGTPEKP